MMKPVFVDLTGRRRRAAIIVGSGLGVFLVLGLIALLAGLFSGSPVPLPGWPDAVQRGADVVPTVATPAPHPTAERTRSSTTTPGKTTTPQASPTAQPGNGNGIGPSNGNGHGRPSRSPGKP